MVGAPPGPDILCNKEIKFRAFLDYAKALGADKIATGIVQTGTRDDKATLVKGRDAGKDDYFLHQVEHTALQDTLFPIGELEKPKSVHHSEHNFGTATKKTAQELLYRGKALLIS